MIECHKSSLVLLCEHYGYSLDEIRGCIVETRGDTCIIDDSDKLYPRTPRPGFPKPRTSSSVIAESYDRKVCLAGTELHNLLGRFGISGSGDCKCTSRASLMDANGCDWCEANIEEIVGWLREAAEERGLPFLDLPARLLVKRAIHNARKAEARRAKEAEQAAAEGRPA